VQALEFALEVAIMIAMATREYEFEVKLGRIDADQSSGVKRVRAAVRVRSRAAGGPKTELAPTAGIRAHFRKGSAGKARPVIASQRRVMVKARFAVHGAARGAPLKAHVSYLARESAEPGKSEPGLERSVDYLQREETPARSGLAFYNGQELGLDAKAVTANWASDARHFRLIISAEDGKALGDLRPMIREVMANLEMKLGTKLEWLAVDHWDTDNPHTHVLVRGKTADGEDLFIPSKIISHGIREHAQEVVTRVLGPRLEANLRQARWREVGQMGVTTLDRELVAARSDRGIIAVHRPDLIARLERLEAWKLADYTRGGWRIADDLFGALRAMERHAEVEQAVSFHRSEGWQLPVRAADPHQAVEGALIHLGPADDIGDAILVVIETARGELRYQRFERNGDLAPLQGTRPGAVIAFYPNIPEIRPSDRAVAEIAGRAGGIYSAAHHLRETPRVDRGLVDANIRRLEAMRRMSLVSRTDVGDFIVGYDHLKRAMMYEERVAQRFPMSPVVLSYWSVEEQVQAIGPTRLDRIINGELALPEGEGAFARRYSLAVQQRLVFLIERGWIRDRTLSPAEFAAMSQRERSSAADALGRHLGKPVLTASLNHVRGVYVQYIDLAQGRMAVIDSGRHAVLVEWRPVMEAFAGREIEGMSRGRTFSWSLARGRELGLGLG